MREPSSARTHGHSPCHRPHTRLLSRLVDHHLPRHEHMCKNPQHRQHNTIRRGQGCPRQYKAKSWQGLTRRCYTVPASFSASSSCQSDGTNLARITSHPKFTQWPVIAVLSRGPDTSHQRHCGPPWVTPLSTHLWCNRAPTPPSTRTSRHYTSSYPGEATIENEKRRLKYNSQFVIKQSISVQASSSLGRENLPLSSASCDSAVFKQQSQPTN